MDKGKENQLQTLAAKLRNRSLKMALDAGNKGSHLGGGLSLVEVFACLYGGILQFDTNNHFNENHDRLIVSKGHCVLPYYTVLHEFGFLSDEDISGFETNGGILHGHATRDLSRGIEFSGGSLGLGLSYAIGVAIAGKLNGRSYHVYVIVGDGECNEGIVWESIMSASHFKLDNLTIIVDHNKLQYDGSVSTVMDMINLKAKFDVFGFLTTEVDGHDVSKLYHSFELHQTGKPRAIIANTVKGKGVSFMENQKQWHHSVLTLEQFNAAMQEQTNQIQ